MFDPGERPFPILGLSGGIASGKSWIGHWLATRGWAVLDADLTAREVVAPGSEGLAAVVARFGADFLRPDGGLDRERLASRVFADPSARASLNALLHPRIEARLLEQIAALPPATRGVVL